MEQKKKKGYGAGIVTGILATVLVSLLLMGDSGSLRTQPAVMHPVK